MESSNSITLTMSDTRPRTWPTLDLEYVASSKLRQLSFNMPPDVTVPFRRSPTRQAQFNPNVL